MSPAWCMRSLAWILSNTAWKPIHMPFARMYPFPHGWLRWPISGVSTARRCFRMHFATCSGGRNVDRTNIYKERPSPGRSFGSTGSKKRSRWNGAVRGNALSPTSLSLNDKPSKSGIGGKNGHAQKNYWELPVFCPPDFWERIKKRSARFLAASSPVPIRWPISRQLAPSR